LLLLLLLLLRDCLRFLPEGIDPVARGQHFKKENKMAAALRAGRHFSCLLANYYYHYYYIIFLFKEKFLPFFFPFPSLEINSL